MYNFRFCSEMCNSKQQCEDLSKIIREMCPKAEVLCHTGRRGIAFHLIKLFELSVFHRELMKLILVLIPVYSHTGSFEVQINNELVHSRLASLAFPDYKDVARNVQMAAQGQPVSKAKEQPITDCVIQ